MKKFFLLALLFLFFLKADLALAASDVPDVGPVTVRNQGLDPALAAYIEKYVQRRMHEWHSPGIAVGIVSGSTLIYEGYFGWADIKDRKPVTDTTEFRIGSISKTFTAIGLMQQWEQGKFKLDDAVNSCTPYPVFRPKDSSCPPVDFEHVVTHTSGGGELMSYRQILHPFLTIVPFPGHERKPLSEIFRDGVRPGLCQGEKWAYCNFCVSALGLALETLSGESFRDYTQNHILGPIGMNDSSFYEDRKIMDNLAQGYHYKASVKQYAETRFWPIAAVPMGNMFSTVPDMARYMIALINHGQNSSGRLLKPETLAMMYSPHYQLDPRQSGMGINFIIESDRLGHRVVGHDGAVPGFGALMLVAPDDKLGLVVLANVMSKPPYEIGGGILKLLIGYDDQVEYPEPDRSVWPQLAGYYGSAHPEALSDYRFLMGTLGAFEVKVKGDELILGSLRGGEHKLRQVSKDDPYFYQVIIEDHELPSYMVFERDARGAVNSILVGMNRCVRLSREELTRVKLKAGALALVPPIL